MDDKVIENLHIKHAKCFQIVKGNKVKFSKNKIELQKKNKIFAKFSENF